MADFTIALSDPDSARFGFACVRADAITKADIPEALDFSRRHGARVIMARSDTDDIETARALEDEGFRLADTLVFWRVEFEGLRMPAPRLALPIRCFRPADIEQIVEVARVLFGDYDGHYKADPMLDRAKVAEAYADWARRSCLDRSVAAQILVAHDGERIGGFVTLRLNDAEDGELLLGGVHSDYAGRGIYRDLLIASMKWCLAQGRLRMVIKSQVNNYAAQSVWAQLGFKQYRSQYTFHKWFQAQPADRATP